MWLAVFVLSLRAFVPVGFMPSVDALLDGRFEMTICTGTGGMRTVMVDAHGNLVQTPGGDGQDNSSLHLEQCPFGAMGALLPMPAVAPVIVGSVVIESTQILVPRLHALPPLPAQGPPLGSRAPPFTFG